MDSSEEDINEEINEDFSEEAKNDDIVQENSSDHSSINGSMRIIKCLNKPTSSSADIGNDTELPNIPNKLTNVSPAHKSSDTVYDSEWSPLNLPSVQNEFTALSPSFEEFFDPNKNKFPSERASTNDKNDRKQLSNGNIKFSELALTPSYSPVHISQQQMSLPVKLKSSFSQSFIGADDYTIEINDKTNDTRNNPFPKRLLPLTEADNKSTRDNNQRKFSDIQVGAFKVLQMTSVLDAFASSSTLSSTGNSGNTGKPIRNIRPSSQQINVLCDLLNDIPDRVSRPLSAASRPSSTGSGPNSSSSSSSKINSKSRMTPLTKSSQSSAYTNSNTSHHKSISSLNSSNVYQLLGNPELDPLGLKNKKVAPFKSVLDQVPVQLPLPEPDQPKMIVRRKLLIVDTSHPPEPLEPEVYVKDDTRQQTHDDTLSIDKKNTDARVEILNEYVCERQRKKLINYLDNERRKEDWEMRTAVSPFGVNLKSSFDNHMHRKQVKKQKHKEKLIANQQDKAMKERNQIKDSFDKVIPVLDNVEDLRRERRALLLEEKRLRALLDASRDAVKTSDDRRDAEKAIRLRQQAKLDNRRNMFKTTLNMILQEEQDLIKFKHGVNDEKPDFVVPVVRKKNISILSIT